MASMANAENFSPPARFSPVVSPELYGSTKCPLNPSWQTVTKARKSPRPANIVTSTIRLQQALLALQRTAFSRMQIREFMNVHFDVWKWFADRIGKNLLRHYRLTGIASLGVHVGKRLTRNKSQGL